MCTMALPLAFAIMCILPSAAALPLDDGNSSVLSYNETTSTNNTTPLLVMTNITSITISSQVNETDEERKSRQLDEPEMEVATDIPADFEDWEDNSEATFPLNMAADHDTRNEYHVSSTTTETHLPVIPEDFHRDPETSDHLIENTNDDFHPDTDNGTSIFPFQVSATLDDHHGTALEQHNSSYSADTFTETSHIPVLPIQSEIENDRELAPNSSTTLPLDSASSNVTVATNWWDSLNLTAEENQDILESQPSFLKVVPSRKLIEFSQESKDSWKEIVEEMAKFLEPYDKNHQEDFVRCDFDKGSNGKKSCIYDLLSLGPSCTKDSNFGFSIGKPCVFLAPQHANNWVPQPYANDSEDVPDEIRRLGRIFNPNFAFVTCDSSSESARVHMGPLAYLPPYQGFPNYFFPVPSTTNSASYVAPLVAVEFLNPSNGTIIPVSCSLWANNIHEAEAEDSVRRKASVTFYLKVN